MIKYLNKHQKIKSIVETALIVIVTASFFSVVLKPVMVNGSSMYPNLTNMSYGFTNVIGKEINGVDRFDIVCIDSIAANKKLVKRVIGLPGEIVEYIDNKLYINGVYIEEPFLNGTKTNDFYYKVPKGEYFCLGDNRTNSRDSRNYGSFKEREIFGKDLFVLIKGK